MPNAPELSDVFLSCRGDILETHAVPLFLALRRAQLRTFFYVDRRNPGGRIAEKLRDGVKHSASAIIIFSKEYATSKWCLDELLLILERDRTSYFPIIPIYCDGVSYRAFEEGGSYHRAVENHTTKHGEDKVRIWKDALKEVEGREYKRAKGSKLELDKFFEEVAEDIRDKITPNVKVPPHPKRRWRNFTRRILGKDREERTRITKANTRPDGTVLMKLNRGMSGMDVAAAQPQFEEIGKNEHEQRQDGSGREQLVGDPEHQSSPADQKNDETLHPRRRLQNFIRKIIVKNNKEKEMSSKKLTFHQGEAVPVKMAPNPGEMNPTKVNKYAAGQSHTEGTGENNHEQDGFLAITAEPTVNRGPNNHRQAKDVADSCFEEKKESIHPRRRLQSYIWKIIKNNRAKRTAIPKVIVQPDRMDLMATRSHFLENDEDDHERRANQTTVESINVNGDPRYLRSPKTTPGFEKINERNEPRNENCCWSCGIGPLCVFLLTAHRNFVDTLIRRLTGA